MIRELFQRGLSEKVFPAAQAVVVHRGEVIFDEAVGEASPTTLFDLASLTKVISTTSLFLKAWATGKLGPDTRVGRFVPEAKSAQATIADLLLHRSGLPGFIPYFARVMPAVPELFNEQTPRAVWDEVHKEIINTAFAATPQVEGPRQAVYSDVGFIQLGEILAHVLGAPLDALFEDHVRKPLGLSSIHFRRISDRLPIGDVARTGSTRPREPAPGQEKLWTPFPSHDSRLGEVDDDNAWVLDGVSGHAGLFGTARDVARFGQSVLDELAGRNRIALAPLWDIAVQPDSKTEGSTRALGFDTPSAVGSTAGRYIGNLAPGAFGHLGFTGCSLWIDRGRALVIALISNRVAFGRTPENMPRFRAFAPRFHDAIVESLGLDKTS